MLKKIIAWFIVITTCCVFGLLLVGISYLIATNLQETWMAIKLFLKILLIPAIPIGILFIIAWAFDEIV
jgi:hypothetical protein